MALQLIVSLPNDAGWRGDSLVDLDETRRSTKLCFLHKFPGTWLKLAALNAQDRDAIATFASRFGFLTGFKGEGGAVWHETTTALRLAFAEWVKAGNEGRLAPTVRERFAVDIGAASGDLDRAIDALDPILRRYVTAYVRFDPPHTLAPAMTPTRQGIIGYAALEFLAFTADPLQRARTCEVCGDMMTHRSERARYCSDRCKQVASRAARGETCGGQ